MKVQKFIEIAAPPDKIWPFLVEPDKILKWCITFTKFEYTSEQHSGVGTPFYVEEKVRPLPLLKLNFEATEWVENERIAFRMISGNVAKGYEQRWVIDITPSGSRFTFVENFEFPLAILGKIIGLVGQFGSQANVKKMLAKLKSLVEA